MKTTMMGWQVKLKKAMLGNEVGAIGYVFNEYQDFDNETKSGVQVIFQNGEYDGFSVEEQGLYLEMIHPILDYAEYEFNNIMQTLRDFNAKYWDFGRG